MATTITNWTEFDAAITAGDLDLLITGAVVFPAGTTRTVPEKATLSFTSEGYFDFQDDETAKLIQHGWVDANPSWWIFRNTVTPPLDMGWTGGGGKGYSWRPNVYGNFAAAERSTGWWGARDGVDGTKTIQCAIDSANYSSKRNAVTVRLVAGAYDLSAPIRLFGRNYTRVIGPESGNASIFANSGTFTDDADGLKAMFVQAIPRTIPAGGIDGWAYGIQFSHLYIECNVFGFAIFEFHSFAESCLIEHVSTKVSKSFFRSRYSSIGGRIQQCQVAGEGYGQADLIAFDLGTEVEAFTRIHISDMTINNPNAPSPGLAAFRLRSGQITVSNIHMENYRNVFILGRKGRSDAGRSCSVVAKGIDFAHFENPVEGDERTAQNAFFAVYDWKFTQINASGINIGPSNTRVGQYVMGKEGCWWLKCIEDDAGRDGEIPVNQAGDPNSNYPPGAYGGTGQSFFGHLVFNGRGYRTPEIRVAGVRTAEDGSLCHGHDVIGPGPTWQDKVYDADAYIADVEAEGVTVTAADRTAIEAFYAKDWFNRIPFLQLWFLSWGNEQANQIRMNSGFTENFAITATTQDSMGIHGGGSANVDGPTVADVMGSNKGFSLFALISEEGTEGFVAGAGYGQDTPELKSEITIQADTTDGWVFRGNVHDVNTPVSITPLQPAVVMGVFDEDTQSIYRTSNANGFGEMSDTKGTRDGVPSKAIDLFKGSQLGGRPTFDGTIGMYGLTGSVISQADAQELEQDLIDLWEGVTGNTL